MQYGVSFYPEQKDGQELRHDMELLKESGINTVRMGEFAWCRMEPEPGRYSFEWLKQVVNELGEAGISTILCTPTACPPAWLIEKHPEALYMDNRRIRRPFGGRRHYCYNNEDYRMYSVRIARAMGEAFAGNPYVSGWQLDNEPAQEGTGRCSCPVCEASFRKYLEKTYGTIDAFNKRSGSVFWSQEYTDFRQIPIPVNTIEPGAQDTIRAYYENPTVRLEFERFCSRSQEAYQNLQVEALRPFTDRAITTNGTGLATNSINYYESTKTLDCYAFDYYPGLRDTSVDSFPYAFARGIKNGTPFWVLEFMSGGGHRLGGSGRLQPNPGALRQAVLQSFAHGADMMLHFQFRSFSYGAEQLNYAIVDMDGVPRRRYYEMCDTARDLKKLEFLKGAGFGSRAAVCFDYDSHWALRIKPVNDPLFHYVDYCGRYYHALADAGIGTDVTSLEYALDEQNGYRMIVLPAMIILERQMMEKIKAFTEKGGVIVATFLTAVKNEDNAGYRVPLPAYMNDLFGVQVEEVEPVFETNHTEMEVLAEGREYQGTDGIWSELLSGEARALGYYTGDYKTGCAVITGHEYGEGRAYYLGTDPGTEALEAVLKDAACRAGIEAVSVEKEQGVELVRRLMGEKEFWFVFNFTGKETTIRFGGRKTDVLSGNVFDGVADLPGNGCLVLEQEEEPA